MASAEYKPFQSGASSTICTSFNLSRTLDSILFSNSNYVQLSYLDRSIFSWRADLETCPSPCPFVILIILSDSEQGRPWLPVMHARKMILAASSKRTEYPSLHLAKVTICTLLVPRMGNHVVHPSIPDAINLDLLSNPAVRLSHCRLRLDDGDFSGAL